MRQALYDYLSTDATLNTLVGGRIRPVKLPTGTGYPALTYQVISQETISNLPDLSTIVQARVQFDAWSRAYAEVVAVNTRVKTLLNGYRGPAGTITIQGAWQNSEQDLYEDPIDAYRISSDYMVTYREG